MKIYKLSGYVIDTIPDKDKKMLFDDMVRLELPFMFSRHGHIEMSNIPEDVESEIILNENCNIELCEKCFKKQPSVENNRQIVIGGVYRHFKQGELVKVMSVSEDTENIGFYYVTYINLNNNTIWSRPYDMFLSKVDYKKYPKAKQEYRFELIDNGMGKDNIK